MSNKPRTSKVFSSAFEDLPGPELYDPSWYNNKLRGEFGRLGDCQMTGPVLPKSYHLRSEELEDMDDTDDDSEAPTTLRSSDLPSVHLHDDHRDPAPSSSATLSSRPELINHDDVSMNMASNTEKYLSLGMPSSPVTNASEAATRGLPHSHSTSNIRASHSSPKRALRFSRKSMFGFTIDSGSSSQPQQQADQPHQQEQQLHQQQSQQFLPQQPTQQAQAQFESQRDFGSIGKRHSRMFRASRLFGQPDRSQPQPNVGAGPSQGRVEPPPRQTSVSGGKQALSRSLLRRSVGPSKARHSGTTAAASYFLSSGFGRRSVVFQWPFAPLECLYKLRTLLENRFSATATVQKSDELRMQVPVNSNSDSRQAACALVIAADETTDGSRVLVRRSFGDTLRGSSDEFDWLCAQITEHLRQFNPAIRMVFP